MATVVHERHDHAPPAGPPVRPSGWRRWTAPGWLRVLWLTPLSFLLATGLVAGARAGLGYEPLLAGAPWITTLLVVCPLGFLVGIGGFDFWAYWISGRPTRPDDHSGHGARSWRDYFRVNTDHKVIGIQY
nr:hypothetical protein [Actinomycetota bacterium]